MKPIHPTLEEENQEREAIKSASRRRFLGQGTVFAGALLGSGFISRALAATCGLTPPQTEGPM
jgi:hypothetical protein